MIVMLIVDKLLLIAILLVHGFLLTSCLKENMSGCPEEIRVYFDISTRAGNDAINPTNVDRMNLYVFNHKGFYLSEYSDEQINNFGPDYFIDCSDLLPGKYRFIAWGGMDEVLFSTVPASFEKGKTTFDEAFLVLEHSDGIVFSPMHHLFHSDLSVTVTNSKIQQFLMPISQQTNTITVRTMGLWTNPDHVYTYEIIDDNCTYQFDGSFAEYAHVHHKISKEPYEFKYQMSTHPNDREGQLNVTLTVMRLTENRQPKIKIIDENTNDTLFSYDLIKLIKKIPNVEIGITHDYVIDLLFVYNVDPTVTVYINGWKLQDEETQLVD